MTKLTTPRGQLIVLAVALVLAMSPWFTTAAVIGELRSDWQISTATASWLTIAVQLGFVAGAVVLAATNLADVIPPRTLVLIGAIGAATANAAIVVFDDPGLAIASRAVSGAFLAAVYPPALKAISQWYVEGRGMAMGVMIGALTLGSALPHLINAVGGLAWPVTLLIASALTIVGGGLAQILGRPGPHRSPTPPIDISQLWAIARDRDFQLANLGYFGHMWELYAMWSWIAAFYGDVFRSGRVASFTAFCVIGVGAVGAWYAGTVSDRLGREVAAGRALRWSGATALVFGFLLEAPPVLLVILGLFWGFWVVADSAQFSALVTESVDPRYVGTAVTLQLAVGFILTVFTIFLVPVVRDAHGWGWAFALLAPGPAAGAVAMERLRQRRRLSTTVV